MSIENEVTQVGTLVTADKYMVEIHVWDSGMTGFQVIKIQSDVSWKFLFGVSCVRESDYETPWLIRNREVLADRYIGNTCKTIPTFRFFGWEF